MITYECNNVRCCGESCEYEGQLIIYKNDKQIAFSIDGEPQLTINEDFSGKEVEDDSEYGFTWQENSLYLSLRDLLDLSRILNWWQNDCGEDEPTDLLKSATKTQITNSQEQVTNQVGELEQPKIASLDISDNTKNTNEVKE